MIERTAIKTFASEASGSVLPLFGLSAMVMIGAMAASVDFGRAYSEHSKLQQSADSAALAAAMMLEASVADRKARGENVFSANYADSGATNFSLVVEDNSGDAVDFVDVTATRDLNTLILPLFGYDKLPLRAEVRAPVARVRDAEIVLVLDYSDSMISNDKYVRMKDAAQQLIDAVSINGQNRRAKFGVVPFAAMVKADLPSWAIRSDVTYTGCTQDRRNPFNGMESPPTGADNSKWGEVTSAHNCADMAALNLDVVPLTNDVASVKSKIAAMQPYMWTHIAAGTEIGFQVISPDGVFGGAAPYNSDKTIKVVVILTDGMQTAPGWGPSGDQSVANAESNLLSLCDGMKDRGIKVYAIGYDLTDDHTKTLLSSCSEESRFYDADDIANGLLEAFGDIGKKIREQMVRLSQ